MPRRTHGRNPDVDLRELERQAAAGDERARAKVVRERLRRGVLTVEWLAAAGPEAYRLLPGDLREELWNAAKVVRFTSESRADTGGWFPAHDQVFECPRGHDIRDRPFDYVEVTNVSRRADAGQGHAEGTLLVEGAWPDTGDDPDPFLTCTTCWASWPVQDVEVDYT